jgi:hypothetical protein
VSNGSKTTGTELLKLAYKGAERLVGTTALWSTVVMTDAGVPELPPVYTNGRELGEKRGVTDRTIRTHMQELKKAGLITRYKYRGTNASYCVWINPNFVWETAPAVFSSSKTSPAETPFLASKRKNLPHTELLESLESQKVEISTVEKLVNDREPTEANKTGIPFTGIAGPPSGSEPCKQATKAGVSGAGAARRAKFYAQAHERGTGAKMAEAKRLVESFWHYAKKLVYRRTQFNAEAERQAKNAIWYGVFGGFAEGEPANWLAWMPGLQRRLELAGDWLQRNPSHYAAAPYAEVLAGCGYFDAGNDRGFAGTLPWLQKEQTKKRQGALERALDEAMTELAQRRCLDAGGGGRAGRRLIASKRARQKSLAELHLFHHTKLRRLGGDEALLRFAARLEAETLLYPTL